MPTIELRDVLIIGGGVMGSAVAYHLKNDGYTGRVLVIEKDPLRERSSTSLSAGGFRMQFGSAVNVRIAQYSVPFYENFGELMEVNGEKPDIQLRQRGYLFLGNHENWPTLLKRWELQTSMGVGTEKLTPEEVRKIIPDLRIDDLVGATFNPRDGYLDAYMAMKAFEAKARSLGVEYLYDEVTAVYTEVDVSTPGGRRVTGVSTRKNGDFFAPVVVVAAGAWSGVIGEMAGVEIPVRPVKHQIFICRTAEPIELPLPLTVDPGGLYFREETGRLLLGKSLPGDPEEFDFQFDRRPFEPLWFEAAGRWPYLEQLGLERGWAGLYEMCTLDHNALIGEHPDLGGFYLITGFSGHGLQQAPGAGKALAELIRLGRFETLDVSELSPNRIKTGARVLEDAVV